MRVRSEVSEQNKYWLDKYRYLELKNFCMQYETFKKAYLAKKAAEALGLDGWKSGLLPDGKMRRSKTIVLRTGQDDRGFRERSGRDRCAVSSARCY